MTTTSISNTNGPIKAIHIQVPVGIPTPDGGLEIPNRVFLGGIPTETTELELELFFSDYGMVKDVRIVTDRVTGECKGYGFVTFEETEDITVLLRKKTITMKGKKLRLRKAVRRNGSQFTSSDSSGSSSPEHSPVSANYQQQSSMEPVLFVPQPQAAHYHQHIQQAPLNSYQQCAAIPSSVATHPNVTMSPSPMTYSSSPLPYNNQNFHPVYYYPVMNTPHHYQVPVNIPVPVYQHM